MSDKEIEIGCLAICFPSRVEKGLTTGFPYTNKKCKTRNHWKWIKCDYENSVKGEIDVKYVQIQKINDAGNITTEHLHFHEHSLKR